MIDIEILIQIKKYITEITGCSCHIVDSTGKELTSENSLSPLEKDFFCFPSVWKLCKKIYAEAGLQAAISFQPFFFRFPFQLVQAAIPIFIGEIYFGAVILGMSFGWENIESVVNNQEANIEIFDIKKFAGVLESTSLIEKKQLKNIAELIFIYVKQLINKEEIKKISEKLEYTSVKLSLEKERLKIAEKEEGKIKLERMHMKYNPIFVYHALNTISRLALIENAVKTQEATITWYELHRYSSEAIGQISTFQEEIENVEKYLKIQNIRFQNKFRCEMDYPKEARHLEVPGTAVIHLVEFLVLNDLYPKPEGGTIIIKAFYRQDCCMIQLSDDGIGFTEQELYQVQKEKYLEKDYDLSLFYQANQILIHFYGEYYQAKIKSEKNAGTFIELKIPFMTREG